MPASTRLLHIPAAITACAWLGTDGNNGGFRSTGHSNGTYGYMAVFGGP